VRGSVERVLAAATGSLLLTGAALAQQTPQAPVPAPQFRSGVDLVPLDISVLDRNRRPVRGLTPADFTVFENGKPQEIAMFKAVDIPDPEPPSAPWIREVAADVRTNDGIEERRLFLLLLDDAMIQADVAAMNNVRDIARRVIDRLGPSDLAAVVFTLNNRNSQDFTADRARLRAAVDKFSGGFRDMSTVPSAAGDALYKTYSVNVVEAAVDTLSTMPDRRKAIIYIGQGIPLDLGDLAPVNNPGLGPAGAPSGMSLQGLAGSLQLRLQRAFERAARGNANVYTIDACGLRALPGPRPPAMEASAAPMPVATCVPGLEDDYLKMVAENTGARAVTNTNDFEPGVKAIFEENASYYLVGFQSSDQKADGKLRRLEVRVNRPGVTVRTRNGYQADKPDAARKKAQLAASPLGAALAGLLPKSDLPLEVSAVPFALPGGRESAVLIALGVRQPIRAGAGTTKERVDVQVSAFNTDGKALGSTGLRADITLRPDATGLAEYEVLSRLDLKPGRYQLRIAANVGSLSTSGSLYYDVDVPNFSSSPISLSGLLLSASPGPVVGSHPTFQTVVPVVPTTRRTFTAGHQVSVFTRVYQGGKAAPTSVPVRVQLRNATNELVVDRREELAVTRFSTARSADIKLDVPVARLTAGEYLLTIEAGAQKTMVRRDSRFRIVR
jgi:VWFA-related protein